MPLLCALTLVTLACLIVSWMLAPPPRVVVRWHATPYRSSVPVVLADNHACRSRATTAAAIATLAHLAVMAPALGFALLRWRLGAFTPAVILWLALTSTHAWLGLALLRRPWRAAPYGRGLAHAALVLCGPYLVAGGLHACFASSDHADQCASCLAVGLACLSATVVHALVLLGCIPKAPPRPATRAQDPPPTWPGRRSNAGAVAASRPA